MLSVGWWTGGHTCGHCDEHMKMKHKILTEFNTYIQKILKVTSVNMTTEGTTAWNRPQIIHRHTYIYWGLSTRMVYLYNDIELRYTILVGNPRYTPQNTNTDKKHAYQTSLPLRLINCTPIIKKSKINTTIQISEILTDFLLFQRVLAVTGATEPVMRKRKRQRKERSCRRLLALAVFPPPPPTPQFPHPPNWSWINTPSSIYLSCFLVPSFCKCWNSLLWHKHG